MYNPPNGKCPGVNKCPHFGTTHGCLSCEVFRDDLK